MTRTTDHTVEMERSLYISGFIGLSVGFSLEFYRLLVLDSVLWSGSPLPEWLPVARLLLLLGSLTILMYASILESVSRSIRDVFVFLALLAQWGVPLTLYLDTLLGVGSPAGFLVLIAIGLHGITAGIAAIAVITA